VTPEEALPMPVQPPARESSHTGGFITLVACAASVVIVQSMHGAWHVVADKPVAFGAFALLTLILQVIVVDVYGRGTLSYSGTGLLATAIIFGVGPAMILAVLAAALLLVRMRSPLHRGLFNAANFALSVAAGGYVYHLFADPHQSAFVRLGPSLLAGAAYCIVNVGLLTIVMSLAEGLRPFAVWKERFRWFTPYYLVSGPLAVALTSAYTNVGLVGMLAFTMPPLMMMLSIRQYVSRTRQSVEDVRHANDELRRANAALEARNDDLRELFEFAGGLAARGHDRESLVAFAQEALGRLTGTQVRVNVGLADAGGQLLVAGGHLLGSVSLEESSDYYEERWNRLREALLPQLSTAVESSQLVEQVRKTHLQTIAALSRSMEAKDYYTGGHTERVATVSVALARRLGLSGPELDALEIGALLHDIGKIGIPEAILHKPEPLDEEEWKVMREHPVISEYILSEVELPDLVMQIARSSHERMDGDGYPDGIAGQAIPLAARIVLVADAFDALTSDRPYRRGRSIPAAFEELREHTGTQFCPGVIEALEALLREEPAVLGAPHLRAAGAA
jgi:putative nucleotidyltransferase with HDIG domain